MGAAAAGRVLHQLRSSSIPEALASFATISQLKQTHAHLIVSGLSSHHVTTSRLLACAAIPQRHAGDLPYAQSIFRHQIPSPSLFTFNTMIRGFSQDRSFSSTCIHCYIDMLRRGLCPDKFTFPFVLRACSELMDLALGRQLHGQVVKFGVAGDLFVVNNLIGAYMMGKELGCAEMLFEESCEVVDVVSWTAMVTGSSKVGDIERARWYFDRMPCKNVVSWNAMISEYARSGRIGDARKVFDEMPERDEASWSSMISGFYQVGRYQEALGLFKEGFVGGGEGGGKVVPNEAALVSAVSACGKLRSMEDGVWLHEFIENGKFEMSVKLGSALVDMYGKCGRVEKALKIFNSMTETSDVSWSSIIAGLAYNGFGKQALWLFWKMQVVGLAPSGSTFVSILSACSHAGLVREGCWLFDLMAREYRIRPQIEHYGCMVDLLGRAGLLKEAMEVLKRMPKELHLGGSLGAVAGACKTHGEIVLGEEIGKRLINLEPGQAGRYASLSNIFAAAERWDDRVVLSNLLQTRYVTKVPGNSFVFQ